MRSLETRSFSLSDDMTLWWKWQELCSRVYERYMSEAPVSLQSMSEGTQDSRACKSHLFSDLHKAKAETCSKLLRALSNAYWHTARASESGKIVSGKSSTSSILHFTRQSKLSFHFSQSNHSNIGPSSHKKVF